MRVITDIDPGSPQCPDPATSWVVWEPGGPLRRVAETVFPGGRTLFWADEEGPKLTGEFPVVFWQRHAPISHLDLASGLLERLAASTERIVFVATHSDALRGHFDRRWESGEGNLHVSVVLRETLPVAWAGTGLAALPVLALADCAESLLGKARPVTIKWINDVMLGGAKIGGALSLSHARGQEFIGAVYGMGLNSRRTPTVIGNPFVPRVGSLGLDAEKFPPLEVLRRLLSSFASNHSLLVRKGGAALVERYRDRCEAIGRDVRIYEDGAGLDDTRLAGRRLLARGRVEALLDDMRLVIGGEPLGAGRLAYEEDCPD